jgi:membrane protease YdiL (CAAX protease family)
MNSKPFPPVIKQGWVRAILLLFVFISCSVLVGLTTGFFMASSPFVSQRTASNEVILNVTITSLFINAIVAIALTVIFRRYIDRRSVKSLGLHWPSFEEDAATGFCLAIALLGAATLLLYATGNLEWTEVHFKANDLLKGFILMVLIAFTEEMVFRGYILNNLMESVNKWAALGISAVMFAVAHGSNPGISSVAFANLLLAGLLLGINFIYTRNIWFAVFFHFSWNFVQGPVLGYTVSGLPLKSVLQPDLKGAWWLTGGEFGMEGSFITTCLFVLTLLLFYVIYEKYNGKTVKTSQ